MIGIQREIDILKAKIDQDNLAKKKEEKIRVLEEERNYFLAEALRMDKIFKSQVKSIDNLKSQISILDEEKKFFEGFVLETNKENSKLKKKLLVLGKILSKNGKFIPPLETRNFVEKNAEFVSPEV